MAEPLSKAEPPASPPLSDQSHSSSEGADSPQSSKRRATLNVDGLSLAGLPRLSPPASAGSTPSPVTHVPINAPSLTATAAAPSTTNGAVPTRPTRNERLRTLPRLLSSHGYERPSDAGPVDESGEDEDDEDSTSSSESETETDADETESDAHVEDEPVVGSAVAADGSLLRSPLATPRPGLGGAGSSSRFGWVTFDPLTPTPGLPSSRPVQGQSYFDLPTSTRAQGAKTPTPMTPLVPMSMSSVARGKRPTRHDEVPSIASTSSAAATPVTAPAPAPAPVVEGAVSASATPAAATEAAESSLGMAEYRRRAQSAVDLLSPPLLVDSDDDNSGQAGTAGLIGLDPIWQTGGALKTPSFLSPPLGRTIVPPSPTKILPSQPASPVTPIGPSKLQRRMSMYELHQSVEPPVYHTLYDRPGKPQVVYPREEEGAEGLPDYTCAIHFEGYLPRKMEFTAPSIQAKDRAWKRQYVVLHGTSIKIFKFDLRTHPVQGESDWSQVSAVDAAGKDGPPPLHFHEGEYGADAEPDLPAHSSSRFPISVASAKAKAIEKLHTAATSAGGGGANVLLRHYSLQNAESGLAADYIKRKHVVRVRAEGEQFLLQTKDDRGVIALIEALQAAANIALDLDARPLPKFITLPRRRRRRRRPVTVDPVTGSAVIASGDTSTEAGLATATESRRRAELLTENRLESRLDEMLAQEQSEFAAAGARG